MKRIFTSFLLLALCFVTTWANVEPVYDVPAPGANNRNNDATRLIMGLTVTGGTVNGEAVPFNSVVNKDGENRGEYASQPEVYKDLTAETLEVTAGDNLHFDIKTKELEWMHFYVYIDYNHDGKFDVDTELVSYSYLNGRNSLGYAADPDNLFLPDFQIKEDAKGVKTRMRFKVDWDSNDPTGNKDMSNLIGNNNGTILDYTINIHANVATFPITVKQPAEGGSIVLYDEKGLEVESGAEFAEGSVFEIETTADEGYELVNVLVNGAPYAESTLTVAEPTEVTAEFAKLAVEPEYTYPAPEYNKRGNASARILKTVTLKGATVNGAPAEFTSVVNDANYQPEVYVNRLADVAEMTAGDQIKVELAHGIEWMHSYLYIDYNHDGKFDENTELVSYSFYDVNDGEYGKNSAGESVKNGNATLDLPIFTVAEVAKDVKTRMRLKIDWNNLDPNGSTTAKNPINGNNGTIVDFTANVHAGASAVEKFAVNFEQPAVGGSFQVFNGADEIVSGTQVADGTELTIVAAAAEGYELESYLVNGVAQTENTVVVSGETTIAVSFKTIEVAPVDCTVSLSRPSAQGRYTVLTEDGQIVCHGDVFPSGTTLTLHASPANGYELDYFTANGERIEGDTYVLKGDVEFGVVFKEHASASYLVRLGDAPEQGYISLTLAETGEVLYGGEKVPVGTKIKLTAHSHEDIWVLDYFTANGVKFEGDIYEVTEDVEFNVVFKYETPEPYYDKISEQDNIRASKDSRILNTVTVKGGTNNGEPKEFVSTINDDNFQAEVYVDKTDEVLDLTEGDVVKVEMDHSIIWMHSYLYIDYNRDGDFDDPNELVSYSYLNGENSLGETVNEGPATLDLPEFTVPAVAKDLKTRMRLKIDWDSAEPLGSSRQSIGANSGTIVDFRVQLHKSEVAPVKKFAVTVVEPAMTDGTFIVLNGATAVKGADNMIEEGTQLTLANTPAEGKEFVTYQVNGEDFAGNVVTVDQAMVLSAKFARKEVVPDTKYTVTFSCNDAGTMSVEATTPDGLISTVYSGDHLDKGTPLTITLMPMDGKTFKAMINGEDKSSAFVKHEGIGGFFPDFYDLTLANPTSDVNIQVDFIDPVAPQPEDKVTLTYSVTPAEGGTFLVRDAPG